ncbi:MAG TPA: 50S ribosomal protein L21 [Candidatus Omnitrophota bacterium]|nr:50S ribosomal protein L21 [Candidatus Omnitrophota bacterium]
MYVVVETGGKQYKISKDDIFSVDKIVCKEGHDIKLDKVLLAKDGNSVHVGNPYLKGSVVVCTAVKEYRNPKVVAFKYKRRKSEKKTIGHRQPMVQLKVKDITISK